MSTGGDALTMGQVSGNAGMSIESVGQQPRGIVD